MPRKRRKRNSAAAATWIVAQGGPENAAAKLRFLGPQCWPDHEMLGDIADLLKNELHAATKREIEQCLASD